MSRISIDVTDEEHKRLKAIAALKGVSLKDLLLGDILPDEHRPAKRADDAGLAELVDLLDSRIKEAERRGASKRKVGAIFQQARREVKRGRSG